ncbi:MAG TPA: ABC transporter permease [Thermoanaerobaculia bacterium]|jgi:putative ABC transport system permease protein|nr:ABC transporter permease [Thermoanaerobaculia bacterium]
MVPVARRLLFRNRGGFLVTVAGVAATVSLLLFLFAVHAGVKDGSTRYVRTAGVDIWIAQKGSDNIIKSSSFVPASLAQRVARIDGVAAASPLVRVISKAEIRGRLTSTLFLFGFDPHTRLGAPNAVELKPGEIVLDESFARKYGLHAGDTLTIQRRAFRIAGLSQGTNALLSQFGFVRFEDGAAILGIDDTASFILVRTSGDRAAVARRIREALPSVAVHEADDFTRYHDEELDSGVLPVFFGLAAFGGAVGGLIIALMLYSSALERRDDYATLKALGAGQRYLLRLVVSQSLLVTIAGCIAGILFMCAITPLLLRAIPTLVLLYRPLHALIFPLALAIGALAGIAPLRVLRRIYPGEVFRA